MSHRPRATDVDLQMSDRRLGTLQRLCPDAVTRYRAREQFFALDALTHRHRRLARILRFYSRNDGPVPVTVADWSSCRGAMKDGWCELGDG